MEISLRGWGRNHGNRVIGSVPVTDELVVRNDPMRTSYRNSASIHVSNEGVDATWCTNVKLTGEYRVDIVLSKQEIDTLFRYMHSHQITKEELTEIGIELEDIAPSEEAVEQAVREMRVGAFLRLVGSK
jgi:hypothetical protein